MQTYLVYMRRPWRYVRREHWRDFVSLQLVIGGKTAFHFLNPLLWCLFVLYLFLGRYVGGAYHQLFPKPLLYAGAFSLIFGNFFYIYMYLLACLRRKQYSSMLCALAVVCYWAMMSIAAALALFQLITRPHYWEKTEHGLHLGKQGGAAMPDFADPGRRPSLGDAPTLQLRAVPRPAAAPDSRAGASITSALRAMATIPAPALRRNGRALPRRPKRAFLRDRWLLLTLLTALAFSTCACCYFFQQHEILLYGDAYSHLMLARRFFDSQSPGVAQLGGVWLPLPQVGMLPFIWNDFLWRSGLAGSLPSMGCYVVACCCIFLMARRITHDQVASFVGTLAFLLNPNILYLQSTPLSELVCIATSAMACYFFLSWSQEGATRQLVWAAGSIFLATLARYDGWALFMVMLPLVAVVGLLKRQGWREILGNVLVFGALAGFGIALWLIWNQIIFHDMLYFQKGPFSAQGQAVTINTFGTEQTYHQLWISIKTYGLTLLDTFGSIPLALGLVGMLVLLVRKRLTPETVAVMVLLVPFVFYVLAIYSGQVPIYVPGADPLSDPHRLFDVRFGSAMAVAVGVYLAILTGYVRQASLNASWSKAVRAGYIAVALLIVAQALLIVTGGIITVQDGEYGMSCAFPHPINVYLAQHYNGGKVLDDTFTSNIDGADAGLMLRDIVYDGSGARWAKALANPEAIVDWVIVDPNNVLDMVAQHIDVNSLPFRADFTLVYQERYGLRLYHRNGLPPLPNRTVSPYLATEHSLCQTGVGSP